MNWLGKVFVVVILIMSLVFMGLSMAVYATHKNWKATANDLNKKLTDAKNENTRLIAEHNRRVEELEREKTSIEQQAQKLEAERVALVDRNAQIQTERDGLIQNQREHIAAVASTQKLNEGLTGEVTGLRTLIRDAQQARDTLFKTALDATEALQQAANEYNVARERSEQLTKQVAGMTAVMNAKGIDPATEPGSVVPTVEGVVSQIAAQGRFANGRSDDRLRRRLEDRQHAGSVSRCEIFGPRRNYRNVARQIGRPRRSQVPARADSGGRSCRYPNQALRKLLRDRSRNRAAYWSAGREPTSTRCCWAYRRPRWPSLPARGDRDLAVRAAMDVSLEHSDQSSLSRTGFSLP